MKKLNSLKVGESGIIDSFENSDISIKLMEMGCIPDEKIKIQQIGFSGDPITISVMGYSLCLRLDEANKINVREVEK